MYIAWVVNVFSEQFCADQLLMGTQLHIPVYRHFHYTSFHCDVKIKNGDLKVLGYPLLEYWKLWVLKMKVDLWKDNNWQA